MDHSLVMAKGLVNSMPCHAGPPKVDRWVIAKSFDNTWCAGRGNGKPLQYSCHKKPMTSIKRQKDRPRNQVRRCPVCHWGRVELIALSSRKNEAAGPKEKCFSIVGMSGGKSRVWCYKEQYCIGTWTTRSMNQGNLDVVKQDMAILNINILGISELKWTWTGKFNSDDHYIYHCGQESLRRNGVALEKYQQPQIYR